MPRNRPPETPEQELLSRSRRIETRLTQLMIGLGITTQAHKPVYDPETRRLLLPSPHCSLKEILDSLPQNCQDDIAVCLGDRRVAWLTPG